MASKRPSSELALPVVSPMSLRVAGTAAPPLGVKLSRLAGNGVVEPEVVARARRVVGVVRELAVEDDREHRLVGVGRQRRGRRGEKAEGCSLQGDGGGAGEIVGRVGERQRGRPRRRGAEASSGSGRGRGRQGAGGTRRRVHRSKLWEKETFG